MKWGTVVLVDLDPVRGSEANKVRPAVVVANDRAAAVARQSGRGVLTVLPITSNVARVYSFQGKLDADAAAEAGLDRVSKIQAEQIRSVDVRRIRPQPLGELPEGLVMPLKEALRLHLDL